MVRGTAISLIGSLLGIFICQPMAHARGFGDLSPYFSFVFGDGGGIPADVTNVAYQETLPDGVKLFGELGPIDGARFQGGFVLYWSGLFDGPIQPGAYYTADLDFSVVATGGSLEWGFFSDLWSISGFEAGRILTDLMPMPASGQVSGVHYESSPFTQLGDTGIFQGYLHINWTGFSPTDTFSISIPENSIDITYVPEPSTTLLALVAMVAAPTRNRRATSK